MPRKPPSTTHWPATHPRAQSACGHHAPADRRLEMWPYPDAHSCSHGPRLGPAPAHCPPCAGAHGAAGQGNCRQPRRRGDRVSNIVCTPKKVMCVWLTVSPASACFHALAKRLPISVRLPMLTCALAARAFEAGLGLALIFHSFNIA